MRIIVSVFFFIATSLLFLDLSGYLTIHYSDYVLFLQFIPSLLSFLHILGFAAIGFIVVVILTLLFGRVYCSFICPLGITIDVINYLNKKLHRRRSGKKLKYRFTKPLNFLRFSILGAVIILFLVGSSIGIVLLDPYSNFGRFVTNFAKPIIVGLNNGIVIVLEMFDNYSLLPYKFPTIQLSVIVIPLLIFGLVLWLTIKNGRLYCNTVCPVGSLLGLISKYAIFKIKVNENDCTGCGVCETVCKASCIDSENKSIDFSRCINCFDCFQVCPTEALVYNQPVIRTEKIKSSKKDNGRRGFIITTGMMMIGTLRSVKAQIEKEIKVYKRNTIPEKKEVPITPPGSKSIEHFISNCTACTLCVSACPTNVLQPSLFEYGIEGLLMPHMQNRSGFCNYDCTICGDICPNEAILPQLIENKKLIQIGKAYFEKDNCVVHTQNTDCGACAEHCPTKAVRMVLDPELNLRSPVVEEKICVGCGACEYACPTIPYKAIYVNGNAVHLRAEPPKQDKLDADDQLKEDFPF